jgi:hypothetical protein
MTYKSVDYGKTWTKIGAGVEADDFIKVIREDKKVKDLLYAGSERGFFISYNGGVNFSKFQLNLPVVPAGFWMICQLSSKAKAHLAMQW